MAVGKEMIDLKKLLQLLTNLYDGNASIFADDPADPNNSLITTKYWVKYKDVYPLKNKDDYNMRVARSSK